MVGVLKTSNRSKGAGQLMIAIGLIAIAAGCASALMLGALGWGPLSATIGGIAAAIGLGAIFGLPYCIAFVITVALPAWWLGHLALLGRPIDNGAASGNGVSPVAPALEWYPVGRILLWITAFAAMTTMAALLTLGTDAAAITGALRRGLLRIIGQSDPASSAEIEQRIDALVAIAPAAAALVAMLTLTLNLWLAAKITATSGRLHRPWPDRKRAALPPMTLAALCFAIAFCFSGGLFAIVAQIITVALMMAYALTGFAVLHTLTLAL